jgi:hypothetical protein
VNELQQQDDVTWACLCRSPLLGEGADADDDGGCVAFQGEHHGSTKDTIRILCCAQSHDTALRFAAAFEQICNDEFGRIDIEIERLDDDGDTTATDHSTYRQDHAAAGGGELRRRERGQGRVRERDVLLFTLCVASVPSTIVRRMRKSHQLYVASGRETLHLAPFDLADSSDDVCFVYDDLVDQPWEVLMPTQYSVLGTAAPALRDAVKTWCDTLRPVRHRDRFGWYHADYPAIHELASSYSFVCAVVSGLSEEIRFRLPFVAFPAEMREEDDDRHD